MLSFYTIVGITAGILSFASFVLYYISILRKKTTPNRATWFILTIVGILIYSSYYTLGARDTSWVALSYILGPFIAFVLSIKYGEGGWTTFDRWCLFGSGISLIFWFLSGYSLAILLINILIDLLGILPTVKKSYERPGSEESLPWFFTFISSILNVIAIETWDFNIWIYPIYMILINGMIATLLYFPNYGRKKPSNQ